MDKINLLYATNLIIRTGAVPQQRLSFALLLDDVAYEKAVDIVWSGEDGVQQILAASFHSRVGSSQEYWVAGIAFELSSERSLPGNVEFAVRYRAGGGEYWDSNHGRNHSIQADSGILPGRDRPLLNTAFTNRLADGQRTLPIVVAIDRGVDAKRVTVHWSTDNWRSSNESPCVSARDYWNAAHLSNARNPNHYGSQMWSAELPVGDAFRVRYRISCTSDRQLLCDDNSGNDYVAQRRPLTVLVLNLHCCQEDNQDYKLSQIAQAIGDWDADIVCLQEVAELWNNGQGDWPSNTARIINERLAAPYHLVSDWSHRGFDRYREGVAILSRYPIENHDSRYVSRSSDPLNIHSRKVVRARVHVPYLGAVNVFSAHLSWWDDGFPEQFEALHRWALAEAGTAAATMLCGDFNIKAGSKGYQLVVESNEYDDQYLRANSPQLFRTIFEERRPSWRQELDDDYRIDYVFLRKGSQLGVTAGREVFSERDYGKVSDHFGYLMSFEPK